MVLRQAAATLDASSTLVTKNFNAGGLYILLLDLALLNWPPIRVIGC